MTLRRLAAVLGAALLGLGACAAPPSSAGGANLAPAEFRQALAAQAGVQLVDVREPDEYAEGHLAGAKLLPLGGLEEGLKSLDPKRPVLLYCRSGRRSKLALGLAQSRGFQAAHLQGGVNAWRAAGFPLER